MVDWACQNLQSVNQSSHRNYCNYKFFWLVYLSAPQLRLERKNYLSCNSPGESVIILKILKIFINFKICMCFVSSSSQETNVQTLWHEYRVCESLHLLWEEKLPNWITFTHLGGFLPRLYCIDDKAIFSRLVICWYSPRWFWILIFLIKWITKMYFLLSLHRVSFYKILMCLYHCGQNQARKFLVIEKRLKLIFAAVLCGLNDILWDHMTDSSNIRYLLVCLVLLNFYIRILGEAKENVYVKRCHPPKPPYPLSCSS